MTLLIARPICQCTITFMSGANRCDEKQSQSRLASRFQVFHLLWNIPFGGSCTSCHSPYVHKPPSYAIIYLFSGMRFLDSVLIFIQLLFFLVYNILNIFYETWLHLLKRKKEWKVVNRLEKTILYSNPWKYQHLVHLIEIKAKWFEPFDESPTHHKKSEIHLM